MTSVDRLDEQAELAAVDRDLAAFFADPSQFPDPYPMFARLRSLAPVHWSSYDTWVITGYPEALEALHHPALAREASAQQQFRGLGVREQDAADVVEAVDILLASVINRDPPAHTRLRKLMARAFTPRAVASWEPRIATIVDELVEAVSQRDEFDFLHDLALPLPQAVICELLGVPVEDLSSGPANLSHTKIMTVRGSDGVPPPPQDLRASTQAQLVSQVAYWRRIVTERRRDPRDDLVSLLVQAEEEGDRLSMDELIGSVIILIGAGYETTANLVTNGMLAFLRNPDQFELLKADPSLMPSALEEILRHESPSRGQPRVASAAMEVGGRRIEAGQQVQVLLNACNRDPRVFDDPDRFDITRTDNRHITFTAGVHYCLGATLAKAEATMLFQAVAERLGDLELATDEVQWRPAYIRGVVSLPVRRRRS